MGQIEINHTGSGGGIVLSSDGTNLLLGGSAVGGGAAALLYAVETTGSTNPTANGTLSIAIGSEAEASGVRSIGIGRDATASATNSVAIGTDSVAGISSSIAIQGNISGSGTAASIAMLGTTTAQGVVQIGQNGYVQGQYATAVGYNADVYSSGSNGTALGYNAQVNGSGATALTNSYATNADSFAAAIANNSSSYGTSGAKSIAMGYLSKCSGNYSTAIGNSAVNAGGNSVALGAAGVDIVSGNFNIGIGTSVSIDTDYNAIGIGRSVTVNHDAATAIGYMAISSVKGQYSYSSSYFSGGGTAGRGNGCAYVLYAEGTDATPQVMTTTKSTAAADNQIAAPTNDTCITFLGTIVAMQNGAQAYGSWKIEGLLVNDGGTTTVPTSAITVINNSSSWGLALSADNTNNALKVQVTGEASHNIRWVANIQTSEVTYA